MNREIRLYNFILPIWLLWMFPPAWLLVLPGNLLIDGAVLFLTLTALGCGERRARMRRLLPPFWICGFIADFAGVIWMLLGQLVSGLSGGWSLYFPFAHPAAFAWTLGAVALSGVCIYGLDGFFLKGELSPLPEGSRRRVALAMAVFTAPWTFFIPLF